MTCSSQAAAQLARPARGPFVRPVSTSSSWTESTFPRDKVCAGWITPHVLTDLRVDAHEYQRGRTFQPFTGFRVGLIGSGGDVDVAYGHPVSFGIRRCEFDEFLLRRSGARLRLATPITNIRREGLQWTINDCLTAPMLVGAGGHFCPMGRMLNRSSEGAALVVAQEAEFAIDPRERVVVHHCARAA